MLDAFSHRAIAVLCAAMSVAVVLAEATISPALPNLSLFSRGLHALEVLITCSLVLVCPLPLCRILRPAVPLVKCEATVVKLVGLHRQHFSLAAVSNPNRTRKIISLTNSRPVFVSMQLPGCVRSHMALPTCFL